MKPTGSTTADADLQRLTWYMKGYLDEYKFTAGATNAPNIHEFWGGEGKRLTSFRGIAVYDMLKKYIYGMLIDGLRLSVSNEALSVQADYIYKTESAGIIGVDGETFTRPDELSNDLFIMFYDISMKLNDEPLKGVSSSFTFDGKNNHNVDSTIGFGSRAPQIHANAGKRENDLTLTTTLTKDTVRAILDAEYGEVGAYEPSACKILQIPLELTVSLCELSDLEMKILFPKCTVKVEYDLSGTDVIDATLTLATLGTGTATLNDTTTVETDMYVMIKNNQPDMNGIAYILYDGGVTSSHNDEAFSGVSEYITRTVEDDGAVVENEDDAGEHVISAQKPGTTSSADDWEAPLIIEFDVVESDGDVRIQLYQETGGLSAIRKFSQLGVANGGHVKVTYDGETARFYANGHDIPDYSINVAFTELFRIRFNLTASSSFKYKNFKIY